MTENPRSIKKPRDEYSPRQQRAVSAHLADIGKGSYYGPFETANAAIRFLHREIRERVKKATHPNN
jgi:hypothetical protein